MPSRYSIVVIVSFWLAASGWLLFREFWPQSHSGEPPPVKIDLTDEAGRHVVWGVLKGEKRISWMNTWVKYKREDDTYELHCWFHPRSPDGGSLLNSPLQGMDSWYRVTREGELREAEADITLLIGGEEVKALLKGRVEDGKFIPQWEIMSRRLQAQLGGPLKLGGSPVELPARGAVLNPLQPVNALKGVVAGQTWEMPLFDPLSDSLAASMPGAKQPVRYVKAEVRRPEGPLVWSGGRDECLVIEYTGEDVSARTWVRAHDGKVLRQELSLGDEQLALERVRD